MEDRRSLLLAGLKRINERYLTDDAMGSMAYLPIGDTVNRIVHFHADRSFPFSTKARVPYLTVVEVVDAPWMRQKARRQSGAGAAGAASDSDSDSGTPREARSPSIMRKVVNKLSRKRSGSTPRHLVGEDDDGCVGLCPCACVGDRCLYQARAWADARAAATCLSFVLPGTPWDCTCCRRQQPSARPPLS